jgi:predicted enzyme related to lactoylglutathione lyase
MGRGWDRRERRRRAGGPPEPGDLCVRSADVAGGLASAERLGGTTSLPAMTMPDGTVIGMVADPEGNVIGLVTPPAAP